MYADFLKLLDLLQEGGLPLQMPHSRAMKGGLSELRCKGPEGVGRAFYCTRIGHEVIILHGFLKKTQATPAKELESARRPLREVKP